MRKILSHKLMFESISEPNMVKPPVVYVVGLHRAFGLGIKDQTAYDFLDAHGPAARTTRRTSPAGRAGCRGSTPTRCCRASPSPASCSTARHRRTSPGETAPQAVDRALREIGRPWIAKGSHTTIKDYAARAPSGRTDLRIERQRMIRALVLAGPDAQVM